MSFSNWAEEQILNHVFMNTAMTQPTNIYVALTTAAPAETDTGSSIAEPSGGAYARVSTASGDWTVTVGTDTTASNANAITFPTATASWGTVTHVVLLDAATGGNIIAYGALTTAKTVDVDDTISFAANALSLRLD